MEAVLRDPGPLGDEAHAEALERLAECVGRAAQPEPEWPAAVAAGIAAALRHFASDPAAAHLIVAEPLAAGPRPAYCHRHLVERFSPCLREGREHALQKSGPLLEELIIASFAAMVATQLREGAAEALPGLAPALTRLVLAHYRGSEEARGAASGSAEG